MAIQRNVNQTPADSASAVAQLLAVALLCGHAIHAWGDGTPGPEHRFTTTPTGADLAAPNSWVAFVLSGGGAQTVVLQQGADPTSWWCGFAFGGLSADGGGDTVDTALAGDMRDFHSSDPSFGGGVGNHTPSQLFAADGTYRFSVVGDDVTGSLWAGGWKIATGQRYTCFKFERLTGLHPSDTGPWYLRAAYAADGVFAASTFQSLPGYLWRGKGSALARWDQGHNNVASLANGTSMLDGVQLSPYDNNYEVVGNLPIYSYGFSTDGGYRWKGYSDLRYALSGAPIFDLIDGGSLVVDYIVLDNVLLPWPHGVAPLV